MAGMPWDDDEATPSTTAPAAASSGMPWEDPQATPYDVKEKPSMLSSVSGAGAARFGDMNLNPNTPSPSEMEQAAGGVDVESGAPVSYLKGSLAVNQDAKNAYYKNQLKGMDTRVVDGKLQYVNPKTGRWTMVEPDNKKSLLGGSIDAGGEILAGSAGALGGAVAGGPLGAFAGGVGGATFGGFAADYLKSGLGYWAGVNPRDVMGDPAVKAAIGEGVSAGISDTVFGGPLLAGKGLLSWALKGKSALSPTVAAKVALDAEKYTPIVADLNNLTSEGAPEIKFTLPQMAFHNPESSIASPEAVVALSKQAALRRDPAIQARLNLVKQNNEAGLMDAFENSAIKPYTSNMVDQAKAASEVQSMMLEMNDKQLTPARAQAVAAVQQEQQAIQQLHPGQEVSVSDTANAVRSHLQEAADQAKAGRDQVFGTYRTNAKYSNDGLTSQYQIPVGTDTMAFIKKMQDKASGDFTLLPAEAADAKQYVLKLKENLDAPSFHPEWDTIDRSTGPTVDLAQADNLVQFLNRQDDLARANHPSIPITAKDRADLLHLVQRDRTNFYWDEFDKGNDELMTSRLDANAVQAQYKSKFERELIGSLLMKEGKYSYKLSNPDVLNQIFAEKDDAVARRAGDLIKTDPTAQNELFKYTQATYTKNYMKQDPISGQYSLDPAGHQKFVQDLLDPTLRHFLTPEQTDQFRKLGGVAANTILSQQKLDALTKVWSSNTAARLGEMRPESMVDGFFTKKEEGTDLKPVIGSLRNLYGDYPIQRWQASVADEFYRKVYDPVKKQLDVTKMNTVVTNNEDNFRILYGNGYVENLKKVISGLAANRVGVDSSGVPTRSTPLTDTAGVIEGPMTMMGRLRTRLWNFRYRAANKELEGALYDPDAMRALAVKMNTKNRGYAAAMGGVVTGNALIQNDLY